MMFQKFFSDTIMSRFIKNLLSKEYIPLFDCVSDGDILIKDCYYTYKDFIIRCAETGKLLVDAENDPLYPGDSLFPSVVLFPGTGFTLARFYVLDYYDPESNRSVGYHYNSHVHWYDSETHKHLGNYLRYLKDCKNLDLMAYYNCYNSTEISGVLLKSQRKQGEVSYQFGKDSSCRVVGVPIKFGKKYTIAIDCSTPVLLRSVIYGSSGMIPIANSTNKYYSDKLEGSFMRKERCVFKEPFIYSVETSDKQVYDRQRDLLLLIQLPAINNSSIVVLEGDYRNVSSVRTSAERYAEKLVVCNTCEGKGTTRINDEVVTCRSCDGRGTLVSDPPKSIRNYTFYKNISLLRMNTFDTYAFSDRLVEHLLNNVITHLDEFPTNIASIQHILYQADSIYRNRISSNQAVIGAWDNNIRHAIFRILEQCGDQIYLEDHDGYINKDVEELLKEVIVNATTR